MNEDSAAATTRPLRRKGRLLANMETHGNVTRYYYPAALYLVPATMLGAVLLMEALGFFIPFFGQFTCLAIGLGLPSALLALRYYLKRNIELVTDDYHLTYCDGRDVLQVHWLELWEMEQVDTIMGSKQIAWCEVRTKQGRFRFDQDMINYELLVRTIIKRARLGVNKRTGRSILWLKGYR